MPPTNHLHGFVNHGLYAAGLLILFLLGCGPSARTVPEVVMGPGEELDLGMQDETGTIHFDVVIRNDGDSPVLIEEIQAGCSCTQDDLRQATLEPHSQLTVGLTWSVRYRGPQAITLALLGSHAQTKEVQLLDTLLVRCYVRGFIVLDPPQLLLTRDNTVDNPRSIFVRHFLTDQEDRLLMDSIDCSSYSVKCSLAGESFLNQDISNRATVNQELIVYHTFDSSDRLPATAATVSIQVTRPLKQVLTLPVRFVEH